MAERSRNRFFWKFVSTWLAVILFVFASTLFVKRVTTYFSDFYAEVFPLNQLERGYASRKDALNQLRNCIMQVRSLRESDDFQQHNRTMFKNFKWRFAKQIYKDFSIIQGLGLWKLTRELELLFAEDLSSGNLKEGENSFTGNDSESFTRHFVTHTLCYDKTFTPQGSHRQVDPSFCPRLINLLNDIQQGLQPPLLTMFTWFPDPLVDVERLRRRLLFQNWDLFRPIVQPVLVTDSRVNMALANLYDWPCLPVASYSSEEIPVFRTTVDSISKQFSSTFYGYIRSTTLFDASLLETLLKIKEMYIDNNNKDRNSFPLEDSTSGQSTIRPVLVYGRALRASHVGEMKDLRHVSEVINTTGSRIWTEKKDSLVYFIFSGVNFSDIPDLIVDDKYLTSLLVSRSMALGHLVVDASATINCIHIYRDRNLSEWDRAYLSTKPRDPFFNRRLGGQYFHSQGLKKPVKWLNEVGTKFARSGNIFIDIRSDKSSESHVE